MNLDDIKNVDSAMSRIRDKLNQMDIALQDVHIDKQLNAIVNTSRSMNLLKLRTLKQMVRTLKVMRTGDCSVAYDVEFTSDMFDLLPNHCTGSVTILRCKSLHNIHKHIHYIGNSLRVGNVNQLLPTHMLGVGLIEGVFGVKTINSDLNTLFQDFNWDYENNCEVPINKRDILALQDKLIDAGFIEQARF